MVDLKRLLVPLATGALSAQVSLMAKEQAKEDKAIQPEDMHESNRFFES